LISPKPVSGQLPSSRPHTRNSERDYYSSSNKCLGTGPSSQSVQKGTVFAYWEKRRLGCGSRVWLRISSMRQQQCCHLVRRTDQQQYGSFKVSTEARMYHAIVKRIALQNFLRVNQKDYAPILKGCSPDVHHRFGGHHALGGERHDCDALGRWFEARSGSTLLVRVEDVVLRLHWRMARVSAV
jgi:xanthine/CO dehydrogenase XdhC/CoxF family maturation factor